MYGFNTQPPEGGWYIAKHIDSRLPVSTHSRPKAAGRLPRTISCTALFQHTAARRRLGGTDGICVLATGFNTQPPEGGWYGYDRISVTVFEFQHTAARRRLGSSLLISYLGYEFQHTAARRRLATSKFLICEVVGFQHTAARRRLG